MPRLPVAFQIRNWVLWFGNGVCNETLRQNRKRCERKLICILQSNNLLIPRCTWNTKSGNNIDSKGHWREPDSILGTKLYAYFWLYIQRHCFSWTSIKLIYHHDHCSDFSIFINYAPHRRGGGHTVFGADPVGVGVDVSVTLSCLHDISWTGGRILTEFAWM